MEVTKLMSRIREELNETGHGVFFTDADLNDSLEDGYTLFCLFTGLLNREYILQIEANRVYYDLSHVADYVRPIAVYDPNTKLFLKPISSLVLSNQVLGWETTCGAPLLFCYFPTRLIAFYPHYHVVPLERLIIYYKAYENNFDSLAEIELPSFAEDCLVYYCVSDLYDQVLELNKSMLAWKKFTDDLVMCKGKISRLSMAGEIPAIGESYGGKSIIY